MRRIRRASLFAGAGCVVLLAGCGAAYYGTVIGIIASQKDSGTPIDTSFADTLPTHPMVPGFATVQLSSTLSTVQRTDSSGNAITVTDYGVTSIDFPPGLGESISNRDAGTSLIAGDSLVVRINGDTSQTISFVSAAGDGIAVAAAIQAEVRLLTAATVPAEAYTLFTATYLPATGSYQFVSGAPSATSEVEWQPSQRLSGDAVLSPLSETTAARLGLGVVNGGIEILGEESLGISVFNRGIDTGSTSVSLYLSRDKVLDSADLLFDTISGPAIAVGEARRIYRLNGPPATQILRWDIAQVALDALGVAVDAPRGGVFYVLFENSGTVIASRAPIEVYQPIDEPLTPGLTEPADPLDFTIDRTSSPISGVTGNILNVSMTLSNSGAAVATVSQIPVDMLLSADEFLDDPAAFQDPAGAPTLAGLFLNPTDPNRAITVNLDDTEPGTPGVALTTVAGNTIDVTWNPVDTLSVDDLITALNATGLVFSFADSVGTSSAVGSLDALFAVLTSPQAVAQDVYLGTQTIAYPASPQGTHIPITVAGTIPDTFALDVLPLRLFPMFRIRPPTPGVDPENPRNNVRQAANFLRLYERSDAFFDPDGGVFLPTEDDADFAVLDAVTFRPVNVDSIKQGQQRVFRFAIPDTGIAQNESQVLILLTTDTFDPHLDLLGSSGVLLAQSDDSALGTSPVIFASLQANGTNRNFYLVVSSARFDESDLSGSESFALTVSVNVREAADLALVAASGGDDVNAFTKQRYALNDPLIENKVLIPFSLTKAKAEIAFYLPSRARVRVVSRPVFNVTVDTVFSQFLPGQVGSVDTQPVLGTGFDAVVLRPTGGSVDSFHILEAGAYTVAFSSVNSVTDDQDFRLEVEAQFIPE